MNISNIKYTPTQISRCQQLTTPKQQTNPISNKEIGMFPSYYCSNINFNGSKFGSIDFDYDFYKVSNEIINNHLDKMELTKDLSDDEMDDFRSNLFSCDKMTLMHFMFDKKPAILLNGNYPYFENNEKYSFVRRTLDIPLKDKKSYLSNNIFILNNDLVKQTIDENKELYTKTMGLDENSSTDEIYDELVGENSPLKEQHGFDDIIGITLGFSPINSILFQLEQNIPEKFEARKRPAIYAQKLDKALNCESSPYKHFSEEFKTNVQSSIDFIKDNYFRKPDLGSIGYAYIHIAPDEKHTQKIIKDAEDILDEAENIIG
ncbi:MAG: hypothetical protein NC200_04330 [Candidatus Gastranaerophilales bacterium]|nr:hypothetical protein [Candidatus Gastranaerophilales bacterium]